MTELQAFLWNTKYRIFVKKSRGRGREHPDCCLVSQVSLHSMWTLHEHFLQVAPYIPALNGRFHSYAALVWELEVSVASPSWLLVLWQIGKNRQKSNSSGDIMLYMVRIGINRRFQLCASFVPVVKTHRLFGL